LRERVVGEGVGGHSLPGAKPPIDTASLLAAAAPSHVSDASRERETERGGRLLDLSVGLADREKIDTGCEPTRFERDSSPAMHRCIATVTVTVAVVVAVDLVVIGVVAVGDADVELSLRCCGLRNGFVITASPRVSLSAEGIIRILARCARMAAGCEPQRERERGGKERA